MTWSHYQQLRQAAQGRIQQKLAALQPTGGRGVSIQGSSIALEVASRDDDGLEDEGAAETWEVAVLGRVQGEINGHPFEGPFQVAARVDRRTGIFYSSSFWQETQMFEIRREEEDLSEEERTLKRTFELELMVRAYDGGIYPDGLERGQYRIPVVLRVEEYELVEEAGRTVERVIREHRFVLRRSGFRRSFRPDRRGVFSYLRAVGLERAG